MKIDYKDKKILQILQKNSRMKLTEIAHRCKLPLSTTHDRMKKLTKGQSIKLVTLLDHEQLNTPIKTIYFIESTNRSKTVEILENNLFLNDLKTIQNGADVMACSIFSNLKEQLDFEEVLDELGKWNKHSVIHEIKKCSAKITAL